MIRSSIVYIMIALGLSIAACTSGNTENATGDSGDSTSIGAGPDTTGSMVDTGSTVTDSL